MDINGDARLQGTVRVPTTKKISLNDGQTTSLRESTGKMIFQVGGNDVITLDQTGGLVLNSTPLVVGTNKLNFDTGGTTYLISDGSTYIRNFIASSNKFQVDTNGASVFGTLLLNSTGGNSASFTTPGLTGNRNYTFPDSSGVILNDQNGVSVTGLYSPTQAANFSTNGTLTLSSGVLSLKDHNGNTPSSTNPVWFRWPNPSGGGYLSATFTAATNCVIQDSTSADSWFNGGGGTSFGVATGTGVAWNDLPFAIKLIYNGSTPILGLSRDPAATTTGASTNIGYKDVPPSSQSQSNVILWTTTNQIATFANSSCFTIGAIRLNKTAADDWTFAFLGGIGNQACHDIFGSRTYNMATGQNGATAGSFFVASGGTAPTYTSINVFEYMVDLAGFVTLNWNFVNVAGGTAGAGAVGLALVTPYSKTAATATGFYGSGEAANTGDISTVVTPLIASNSRNVNFYYMSAVPNNETAMNAANQNQTGRSIRGTLRYKAF